VQGAGVNPNIACDIQAAPDTQSNSAATFRLRTPTLRRRYRRLTNYAARALVLAQKNNTLKSNTYK
jgi:hypothetical protein